VGPRYVQTIRCNGRNVSKIQPPLIDNIEKAIDILEYYKDIEPHIWRIISIVQKHPKHFGIVTGQSCLKCAADYLESALDL
jgi:hypothetical protein